jgi:2-methylcitrate dehydratase PrpD
MGLAVAAACALASSAQSAETRNFNLETTRDLVALCSCPPEDPLYAQALQFCFGYMTGMAHLHRALVDAKEIERLACPDHQVTREELARVFLDWAGANTGAMDGPPADGVKRAAVAEWPCSR